MRCSDKKDPTSDNIFRQAAGDRHRGGGRRYCAAAARQGRGAAEARRHAPRHGNDVLWEGGERLVRNGAIHGPVWPGQVGPGRAGNSTGAKEPYQKCVHSSRQSPVAENGINSGSRCKSIPSDFPTALHCIYKQDPFHYQHTTDKTDQGLYFIKNWLKFKQFFLNCWQRRDENICSTLCSGASRLEQSKEK